MHTWSKDSLEIEESLDDSQKIAARCTYPTENNHANNVNTVNTRRRFHSMFECLYFHFFSGNEEDQKSLFELSRVEAETQPWLETLALP